VPRVLYRLHQDHQTKPCPRPSADSAWPNSAPATWLAAGAQSDLIWVPRFVIAEVLLTVQNGGSARVLLILHITQRDAGMGAGFPAAASSCAVPGPGRLTDPAR